MNRKNEKEKKIIKVKQILCLRRIGCQKKPIKKKQKKKTEQCQEVTEGRQLILRNCKIQMKDSHMHLGKLFALFL